MWAWSRHNCIPVRSFPANLFRAAGLACFEIDSFAGNQPHKSGRTQIYFGQEFVSVVAEIPSPAAWRVGSWGGEGYASAPVARRCWKHSRQKTGLP